MAKIYKEIHKESGLISLLNNLEIVIEDKQEGNMKFTFIMREEPNDKRSYTQYNIIDKFNAELLIVNPLKTGITRPIERMQLGTFAFTSKLYADYVLQPAMENNMRPIDVTFYISNE